MFAAPSPQTSLNWFEKLFGFAEESIRGEPETYEATKAKFTVVGDQLTSNVNGASFGVGEFRRPSLGELREAGIEALASSDGVLSGQMTLTHALGDVSVVIGNNPNSVVQAASQFNCLEFVGPAVTPEEGVTGYVCDKTQGPACSVACGPATVYRNYFAPTPRPDGTMQEGQTAECQLNNLQGISDAVGNEPEGRYYRVQGGYTMASDGSLSQLNRVLAGMDRDALRALLRVGVHSDVQVTSSHWGTRANTNGATVTQVFCSACAVTYSRNDRALWQPFATLILEAAYEATLWAAVLHALKHRGDPRARVVFLTALGGGVFGNEMSWIAGAIEAAVAKFQALGVGLDVRVVSYATPVDRHLDRLVDKVAGGGASVVPPTASPAPGRARGGSF